MGKKDVSEVLRRRFFKPESIRDPSVFRPHVTAVVSSIAALDEQTRKERGSAEERYLSSYPFHPDLTDIFYTRWTQLNGFQRTRGILRTFAMALRDAEQWDTSPLVGPNVFLNEPKKKGLAEAAGELASFASVDTGTGKHQAWRPILEGELAKAHTIQSEATGLSHRQMEQAVVAVFLSSQPIGHKILTQELMVLIGAAHPDKIELEKALRRWTELSWFLDEVEVAAGKAWRLGNRPNLRQMHHDACNNRVPTALALATALSAKRGVNLPWFTVKLAIEDGIRARWLELSNDSAAWPCDLAGAQQVILQVPSRVREEPVPKPRGSSWPKMSSKPTESKIWPIRFQTSPKPLSAMPSSSTSALSSVEKPRPTQRLWKRSMRCSLKCPTS